jgi:hypothetical protein
MKRLITLLLIFCNFAFAGNIYVCEGDDLRLAIGDNGYAILSKNLKSSDHTFIIKKPSEYNHFLTNYELNIYNLRISPGETTDAKILKKDVECKLTTN